MRRRLYATVMVAFLIVAVAAPTITSVLSVDDGCTEQTCGDDCAPNCPSCTCAHRTLQVVFWSAASVSPATAAALLPEASHVDVPSGFASRLYRPPRA